MADLTAGRTVLESGRAATPHYGPKFDVAASVTVFQNSLLFLNGSGQLTGTTGATLPCVGYCDKSGGLDNSSGAAGDITYAPRHGVIDLANNGSSITNAHVDRVCYVVDNQTVDLSSSGGTRTMAGVIKGLTPDGTRVFVNVGVQASKSIAALDALSSTSNGQGASLIGLEDAAGTLTATDVEAAFAEIDLFFQRAVADPGDGNAIPVTRSSVIAITTAGAETNTLAIPSFIGQRITLTLDVDGGDRVITASAAINVAGNTIMTFADAGDTIDLIATQVAGGLVWRILGNDGVALS